MFSSLTAATTRGQSLLVLNFKSQNTNTLHSLDAIATTGGFLFIPVDCEPGPFIGGGSSPTVPEGLGRNGTTSERAVDQFRSQVMDSTRSGRGFGSHCNPTVCGQRLVVLSPSGVVMGVIVLRTMNYHGNMTAALGLGVDYLN